MPERWISKTFASFDECPDCEMDDCYMDCIDNGTVHMRKFHRVLLDKEEGWICDHCFNDLCRFDEMSQFERESIDFDEFETMYDNRQPRNEWHIATQIAYNHCDNCPLSSKIEKPFRFFVPTDDYGDMFYLCNTCYNDAEVRQKFERLAKNE